jgi:hypothetical protein
LPPIAAGADAAAAAVRATSVAANAAAVSVARAYLSRFLAVHAARRTTSTSSAYGPSADEIARTLRGEVIDPTPATMAAQDALVATASAALQAALRATPEPLFARLVRVFSLTELDLAILCVLVAPELDYELERAYTFAIDDFTRKRGDVGFIARVIGAGAGASGASAGQHSVDDILTRFADDAPLRRHGVVALGVGAIDAPAALRPARLADRILAFLRGHDTIDELVHGIVRLPKHAVSLDELVLPADVIARIGRALAERPGHVPRVLLAGPDGAGRGLAVEATFARNGRASVRIDLVALVGEGRDGRVADRLAAALREAALRDAAAILDGGTGVLLGDDLPRALVTGITDAAAALTVPIVILLPNRPAWLANAIADLVELDVAGPTFRERLELWRRALPASLVPNEHIEIVAARYSFAGAAIGRAARRAIATASLRDPDSPTITLDDLGDAARLMFSHRLGTMAQRIPSGFVWDDLVLPKETLEAVREVVRFARYKPFLLEDWGFAAKLPYGRGLSAIMAGPPGTGKTMVAGLIAQSLELELYLVDLSQVVSKWVGETEKQLGKIFDAAQAGQALLLFDEADALFAKRTEVKSSNDRYANLEVNYLLQRIESFGGVAILTTNLEASVDPAFKRRLAADVHFYAPERDERLKLWTSLMPAKAPLHPRVNFASLDDDDMCGGHIRNAVLRAAFLAAADDSAITQDHLVRAVRSEYRAMGKVV